jgi:hypothetical protein
MRNYCTALTTSEYLKGSLTIASKSWEYDDLADELVLILTAV